MAILELARIIARQLAVVVNQIVTDGEIGKATCGLNTTTMGAVDLIVLNHGACHRSWPGRAIGIKEDRRKMLSPSPSQAKILFPAKVLLTTPLSLYGWLTI